MTDLYESIQKLLAISESNIKIAQEASDAIHEIHCRYCEVFRNEIDNLWQKEDARYKMLRMFGEVAEPFRTIISFEKEKRRLDKKAKEAK